MGEYRSAAVLACIYTGTVIGAGFASGQEIWQFFGRLGAAGFWGLITTSVILAIAGAGIFLKVYRLDLRSYHEFCIEVFGTKIGGVVVLLGNLFMFCSFCVMLSGSGAVFAQEAGQTPSFGIALMAAFCLIVFLKGTDGVAMVNIFLAPIMMVGILILGAHTILYGDRGVVNSFSELVKMNDNALVAAMVYASYNLLTLPGIITVVRKKIVSSRAACIGGIAGGALLCIGALCIYAASLTPGVYLYEVPALTAAGHIGKYFRLYYGIVIYMAMLTTAVSCGMGFIRSLNPKPTTFLPLAVCILASLLALAGFSRLVQVFYTAFGYIGIFITIMVLRQSIKEIAIMRYGENEVDKCSMKSIISRKWGKRV